MASSEHPETPSSPIGIQKPSGIQAPAEAPPVALPPLPQKPAIDPATFLRLRSRLDAPLVAGVLLFAFLVASFAATNSDFFRHAALGRMLANGEYRFGVDPLVYTGGDTYFANHSWLFDLLMYGLYRIPKIGGADAVVVFKAILTAVLAVILLRAGRRAGQSLWIPAVCTALAILVASPRLLLQSTCLSFLFLGVTVWLLAAVDKGEKRMGWLLPPLFVLWVNCDAWFVLGPLAVALYLVGGLLEQGLSGEPAATAHPAANAAGSPKPATDFRTLGLVLAVGVVACLVNPHHYHAFTLPPEFGLTPAGGLIERDPQFFSYFLSPLGKDYYRPQLGLSAAGLAYWPLLALGLVSFVFLFVSRQAPWRRLFLWSGFALLSLYNMRAIPFFAIVAGPIASLNWLDCSVQRLGAGPRLTRGWRSWSLGGRILTGLLVLVLLIATVPGWLQRSLPSFRRLAWNVQVDPSLHAMAQTIRDWRTAGLLPDDPHWFNMHPEIANYLAWYAPGERVFVDQNLPYCREAAQDYLDIRKGLEQMLAEQSPDEGDTVALKTDWQKILRHHQVRYWIFDNFTQGRASAVARGFLFSRPDEWVLCHLQGRIAVFAWRDPQQPGPDPSRGLALDLPSAAFGPKAERVPPRGAEPAPLREWWQMAWDAWRQPNPPPSSDREVVELYNFRFELVEVPRHITQYSRIWQGGMAASAIAGSLPHGPMPNSLLAWSWSSTYHDLFPPRAEQPTRRPNKSEEPAMQARDVYVSNRFIEPPSLYLAIRAARRALVVDPEDGITYFLLGQIYQRLRDLPQERNLQSPALQLPAIRRTQIAAALQNYLLLQPDGRFATQAHLALFRLYSEQLGYIDAAVHHLRQALDQRTAAGPQPGQSATQFNQMLDQMSARLTRLDGELERRLNRYEVNAAAKTGLEKVQVALELGLSETALTAVGEATGEEASTSTGVAIIKRIREVVLNLGQLDKARDLMPDPEGEPVKPEELDDYVRLAAARGDYTEADRLLDEALQRQPALGDLSSAAAQMIARVLLGEARAATNTPRLPLLAPQLALQFPSDFWVNRLRMDAIFSALLVARQRGEWHLTRGWLALEAGRCGEARQHFQTARELAVSFRHWATEVDQLIPRLVPQQELQRWQQQELPRWQQLGSSHALLIGLSGHYLKWLEEKRTP